MYFYYDQTQTTLRSYIILLFVWCYTYGFCQTSSITFNSISLDQGHTNHIMRDSEGFIWISTQDGLTKYNGTHYIQYNYDRRDSNSIAHNYVWTTFEDSHKNLWVGLFGGGLCRFNKAEEKFYRYTDYGTIKDHGIRTFDQLNDSTLIVGTDHGLYLFDLFNYEFCSTEEFLTNQFKIDYYHSHSIGVFDKDVIVAGENGGYILTPSTNKVEKINPTLLDLEKIRFIKKIGPNRLFIADHTNLLIVRYLQSEKKFEPELRLKSNTSLDINDLEKLQDSVFLLASEEGLYILDFALQQIDLIAHDIPKENNLRDKVAYSIAEIEPDLFWIGTKTNIYEYSQKPNNFQHILSEQLCGSAILGMTEDNNGNLWVCTRRGIGRIKNFHLSKERWEYFCYDSKTNPEMRNEYVLNVDVIKDMILVGYRKNGFSRLLLSNEDNIHLIDPPSKVDSITKNGSVSNFLLDSDNFIWISTSGNGVVKWNYKNQNQAVCYKNQDGHTDVLPHNYTFGFEQINDSWIAVATAAGIGVIHRQIDSTYSIVSGNDSTSLSGNFIMDFHTTKDGKIWICTDGGINLWNNENDFTSWTKSNGLPNEVIYGMLDYEDELWISSNKGLVRIRDLENPVFKTFSVNDNVLNEEHNQFSFYKSKNNQLLFGGKNGISYFDPSKITPNPIDSEPVIENFQIFNTSGNARIDHHINYVDEISLNHNENFLSFELSSLSYFKSDQNQYRYKLKPLHEQWIETGNRNFISLNGLAPGKYKLAIQSSNNDGIWGDKTKEIQLTISNPIYARWYAWLFYLVVLFSIIYAFYKMKINHITNLSRAREEERIKIRERSAKDFHDEVGSLVTKLSLLNQFVLSNTPSSEEENIGILNKMQSNIQRIRTGMKDFIWVLDPNKDSLNSAIIKIKEIGNDLFEHSGTKFQCFVDATIDKEIDLNGVQRRQLILLIKEALHNVIKHSKATTCKITIDQQSNNLRIHIKDDGIGFDLSAFEAGYGLKSIEERARKINGTFTINSSSNIGTSILILLPYPPNGS